MSKYFNWHLLLFLFSFVVFADLANSTAIKDDDQIIESLEEIDDLNKNNSKLMSSPSGKSSQPSFTHRDEDMLADLKQSTIFANLKYDVEILESSEVKNEGLEIEERYRGPAITLNTDNFINENIEVNANSDDLDENVTQEASHLILTIILLLLALVFIGLYVALVVWRRHIEQRYGMRELLVSSDNQDYWPQVVMTSAIAQNQLPYQQQCQQHLQL